MKKITIGALGVIGLCGAAVAGQTAVVRIAGGASAGERRVELEEVDASHCRFTMKKADIPADAGAVDVVPDFMTAAKGDAGYWMNARGTYGTFDKADGTFSAWRSLMPIYALRRGDEMWYAHVRTWRFDYSLVVRAQAGKYEIYPSFRCGSKRTAGKGSLWQGHGFGVKDFFDDYYQDIVVDFHRVTPTAGRAPDYNDVARAYRKFQLTEGGCRTIKDRLTPELDYLCDAIVVRIQTHAAKPIPETKDGIVQKFFKAGEELPVVVHMPFALCEEYLQAFKDAGIDKLSICSAGWQNGGYDGRQPWHFPICAEAGGEEAFKRLIEKAKKLGYQFALHATNTDGYMCSPKWDEDWVCKFGNGSLYQGGLWAGGQCYWVCQKCAWERWIPEEMKMMADLGIRGPHYVDVYSATYPIPCGDRKHPCTSEEIADYQNKVLQHGRDLMGASGSESGYDHVAKSLDYINYVERDLKSLHEGKHNALVSGVYPVWELVYHGIILYTSDRLCQNHTRGKCLYKLEKSGDPRWMEGDGVEDPYVALKIVEFGGRPIFYTYKFADVPRIRKAWDEFVPVRHLQRVEMTAHRALAPQVFETSYANGERTVCNYGAAPYDLGGGKTVAPMGYLLLK